MTVSVPDVGGDVVRSPWLPLTSAQQGLWFAHVLAPEVPAYTTAEVVEFDARVDAARLGQALRTVQEEFEQLRTRFEVRDGVPGQVVAPTPQVSLDTVRVADVAQAQAWCDADLARPMDPEGGDVVRWTLLELADGTTWWYLAAHHLVLDGYGVQQMVRRVEELCLPDAAAIPPAPTGRLADVVADDDARTGGDEAAAAQRWWTEALADAEGTSSLAGRQLPPAGRARRAARVLTADEAAALRTGARRLGLSWPDFVTAAVALYVARMSGEPQVRVGTPLANRSLEGVGALPSASTVVTATNVLPVPLRCRAGAPLGDLLDEVVAAQAEVRRRPLVRQEWLQRHLTRTRPGVSLFGPQVNVIPFDLAVTLPAADGTPVGGVVRNLSAGPVEDLTVCLRGTPRPGRVCRLELDAHPDLYDEATLGLHLDRLVAWLVTVAGADRALPADELPLVSEAEHTLVTELFNDTAHERTPATLAERFEEAVRLFPDAVAVRHGDTEVTYAALHAAARRIAAGLLARGVGPGEVVGVEVERSVLLYAALHGVQMAGAVHLPLDPELPAARRAEMIQDAGARVVIDATRVPDADPATHLARGPVRVAVDDAAYLLFTSGSTGRPKGVLVGHAAIDNRLAWQQHHLPVTVGDRVLHKTPISFDVSVWEHFWPLQHGATVVIADPGAHRDPVALTELVISERIDVLHFVPSMLRALLAVPSARRRLAQAAVARGGSAVRHLVTSGEALTPDLVDDAARVLGVCPVNLYGPTEAAVDVTCLDTRVGASETTIGRPIWNTRCFVLDERLAPVPVGVAGELWLAGVQLAHGYLGRPDLTDERFVPLPAALAPQGPAAERGDLRMYRTGDLATWTADGQLRYLGRTDDQVKIHGQRVELGEIEAVACAVDAVAGAVAGVVDQAGRPTLVLWWVADARGDADLVDVAARVQDALGRHLPQAWQPVLVPVPEIPVGTSGKADRRALARFHPPASAAAQFDRDAEREYEAVGGLVEERLAGCMADVLGGARPGVSTDFFAAGGDSLAVLALVARVEEEFGVSLAVRDVFARPNVRALAALLTDRGEAGDATGAGSRQRDVDHVLVLRPGDPGRAPLVLLPPAGGLGWAYARLLRHLPVELPVVVVQGEGLGEGHPVHHRDLDSLVTRQWQALTTALPDVFGPGSGIGAGTLPVHLAGWSLGGMAAHAMAAHLNGEGVQVGAVVLLDAYPSTQWSHLARPTQAEALVGVLRMAGLDAEAVLADRGAEDLDVSAVVDLLTRSGSAVAALPEDVLRGCVAHVVASTGVVRDSVTPLMTGDLHVVVAGAPRSEDWLDVAGWAAHVSGEVTTTVLPATHGELLRHPWAAEVGAVLTARCAAAEAGEAVVAGAGRG